MKKLIVIDSELHEVNSIKSWGYGIDIETDQGDYKIFDTREEAGEQAKEYWRDMMENDPSEFTCIVGEENLIKWALGQSAGPGTSKVNSVQEWLDLWLDLPEEQWASYDGTERSVDSMNNNLRRELEEHFSFEVHELVVYRTN